MINIEERHFAILKDILSHYDYNFYLFGSRITDKVKPFSDIDLFYVEPIPAKTISQLEEELEESDLPYEVDLVDYQQCDADFQKILKSNYIQIQHRSGKKI